MRTKRSPTARRKAKPRWPRWALLPDSYEAIERGERLEPIPSQEELRGKKYTLSKKAHGGQIPGMGQNDPSLPRTSESIAADEGVSEATMQPAVMTATNTQR